MTPSNKRPSDKHSRSSAAHYCTLSASFADAERGETDGTLLITAPAGAYDLPVIAFVHGGRYEEGDPADVDAAALSELGFVVVSIGYRLGLSGFAQFHDDAPAHYRGIADVQLALEWMQKHIEDYGGDPTNVTLVGHSFGAAMALWLARRDHYRGAFRRLVALSPGFPTGGFTARKSVLRFFLGAPITRASLNRLAESSPRRLARAYAGFRTVFFEAPALGPWPWDSAELASLPILITSTRHEFYSEPISVLLDRLRLGGVAARSLWHRYAGYSGDTRGNRRALRSYLSAIPKAERARRFVSDTVIRRWVSAVAEAAPGPVWVGELTGPERTSKTGDSETPPSTAEQHALHCADIQLFFSQDAHPMRSDILAFVRGDKPDWPEFSTSDTADDHARMGRQWPLDGGSPRLAQDPLRTVRTLFEQR